jgi:hypothetical protein
MCEWGVNKASFSTAASVMAKIMEVTANLWRATVEKACKFFGCILRQWLRLAAIFSNTVQ